MENLKNKVIYVVATGCRKSKDLPQFIKKIEEEGAKVYLFATEAATEIVNFESADFNNINLRLKNDLSKTNEIEEEDMVVIAPCSYNTLNKIANGIADSYPLSIIQTAIGKNKTVILSLSMNINLWNNFQTQRSIKILSQVDNVRVIWPNIILNEDGKEISTTMSPWDKLIDTVLSSFHILTFNVECLKSNNSYNKKINNSFNELSVFGKACQEFSICPNTAGCIAKKLDEGILVSATGSSLGNLNVDDMVLIKKYDDDIIYYEGLKRPTSESIIIWELLKDKPVNTCLIHCHCSRITYSYKSKTFTTKNYFMGRKEQIEEVKKIINKNGFVNLFLHGQIFIGNSFEYIIGKISYLYCK